MDPEDRRLAEAEREASREYQRRASNEIERAISASSVSSASSSSSSSVSVRRVGMSRVSTQADLERHPTELGRIATQRSQHQSTVGGGLRTRTRESRRPLPAFGAGKPYPPMLPAQE